MKWLDNLEKIELDVAADAATHSQEWTNEELDALPKWVAMKFKAVRAIIGENATFIKGREWATFGGVCHPMHALANYLSLEKLLRRVPKIAISVAEALVVEDRQMENWMLSHDELADYGLVKGRPVDFPEDTLRKEFFLVNTTSEFRDIRDEMTDPAECSRNDLAKLYSLGELEVMNEVHDFERLVEEVEAEAAASAGTLEN